MRILHIRSVVGLRLGLTLSRICVFCCPVSCELQSLVGNGVSLPGLERADNCQSYHQILLNIWALGDTPCLHGILTGLRIVVAARLNVFSWRKNPLACDAVIVTVLGAADVIVRNSGIQFELFGDVFIIAQQFVIVVVFTNCGSKWSSKLTSEKLPTTSKQLQLIISSSNGQYEQVCRLQYVGH